MKIVVIGGGAAGLGVAVPRRARTLSAEVVVYTEYEDVAYSPAASRSCTGRRSSPSRSCSSATKEQYVAAGIDVHYETTVESIDTSSKTIKVSGEGEVSYDKLVLATGWNYDTPDVPGADSAASTT